METKSISHISRQVSLKPFVTGMSVVRMTVRISVVDDFEVPSTTLYDCVDSGHTGKSVGSQGNTDTDTDTDTDTHRHTVRWVLLNNPSCLVHRLHIIILHPLVEGTRTETYGSSSTWFPMFPKHVPRTLKKNPSLAVTLSLRLSQLRLINLLFALFLEQPRFQRSCGEKNLSWSANKESFGVCLNKKKRCTRPERTP